MDWLEITVNCDPEHAEAVADVLARYAPGGVAIQQNALDLTGGRVAARWPAGAGRVRARVPGR